MKLNPLIRELLLLITLSLIVILIFCIATSAHSGNKLFDISLHNVYFIIAGRLFIIPVLLALITVVYIIKEAFYVYKRKFQNIVLLISTLLANIYLLFFVKLSAVLFAINCGRTVYPPLSALRNSRPPMSSSNFDDRLTILFYIQIIFLVVLVTISILTGKSLSKQQI